MIDTANLEDGFYWVRSQHGWTPAWYSEATKNWVLTGYNGYVSSLMLDEIDPRPIKREELT